MKTLFLALAVLTLVVLPAWSSTPTRSGIEAANLRPGPAA